MRLKNSLFYLVVIVLIVGGQFLVNRELVTGAPPPIASKTLTGLPVLQAGKEPKLIYFWAEWCGICNMMKDSVTSVLDDYSGITVAVRSGNDAEVKAYLRQKGLNWLVINDAEGEVAGRYGVKGVPAAFYLNASGDIVLTSVGYSSEWGMRFRLWLSGML